MIINLGKTAVEDLILIYYACFQSDGWPEWNLRSLSKQILMIGEMGIIFVKPCALLIPCHVHSACE